MESPKKRRGISLTHSIPRQPIFETNPKYAQSHINLIRSDLCFGQDQNITSIPLGGYRSCSAPKPQIIFTYKEQYPCKIDHNYKPTPVLVAERLVQSVTPVKNQYLSSQQWQEQQRTIKQSAFGGSYGSFIESKDTINKRLFGQESPKHQYLREFKAEEEPYSQKSAQLEKNRQDFYSMVSYNEVISRRRSRLDFQKDVVSLKIKEKSRLNLDSGLKLLQKEQGSDLKLKPVQKDEKTFSKNLQNLRDMQSKLKEIIRICDKTI